MERYETWRTLLTFYGTRTSDDSDVLDADIFFADHTRNAGA